MALPEMCSPMPEISKDEKRKIPALKMQEYLAVERYRTPWIKRAPPIPMYAFVANRTAELAPQPTSPGMDMWVDFRKAVTDELNYPRWTGRFEFDGVSHTTTLFHIVGENQAGEYNYRLLRCSCCLPDYHLATEIYEEYQPCPAKDLVIAQRAQIYKELFAPNYNMINEIRNRAFVGALKTIMGIIKTDPLAWPPSHRNDQLLLEGVAQIFDMPIAELHEEAKVLQENNIVILHGETHPSITIAA